LDSAGITFGVEIGFEIVERAIARLIAEDFMQVQNIVECHEVCLAGGHNSSHQYLVMDTGVQYQTLTT
jgi:hypothetical protein